MSLVAMAVHLPAWLRTARQYAHAEDGRFRKSMAHVRRPVEMEFLRVSSNVMTGTWSTTMGARPHVRLKAATKLATVRVGLSLESMVFVQPPVET